MADGDLAPGAPGIEPRWTSSSKVGVGTAASIGSRLWFTLSHGILNELYFPRTDLANIRDGQFLVAADGYFSEEKRDTAHEVDQLDPWAPAYRLTNTCVEGRYRIVKDVVVDPMRSTLLQRVRFEPLRGALRDYRVYLLVAPHILNHGHDNTAWVDDYEGIPMLFATRRGTYLALTCSSGFLARSVGYVGTSDGWQDISQHNEMQWRYRSAPNGNIALTGQIALPADGTFTIGLAFGQTPTEAAQQARVSVLKGFDQCLGEYVDGWHGATRGLHPLSEHAADGGRLYRTSAIVLFSHMDKCIPGATVASLSIPWGEIKGDGDLGGYHLVWARDLVESATARLAIGETHRAWETLLYLASIQQEEGSWPQNNWLDGEPYWMGVQLDETAFPILLAWRLRDVAARAGFDLWPMVRKAAAFLARTGPVTPEERWEEDGGYSPSTLATCIAALICAAEFARTAGEEGVAASLEAVADWWSSKVESWTFTTEGDVLPGHMRYYERLGVPMFGQDGARKSGVIAIRNLPPDQPQEYDARDVVDTGFLELVRFGVRRPDDPHILSSLAVIDALLKVDLPCGPCWHRYNHDGYGDKRDGSPFDGTGIGRVWPLLTGERAHYELAAGNAAEARRLAAAMECFANEGGLLPEQLWDGSDIPRWELVFGRPSGSAMPLVWAHAEYLKLLRSLADGKVFDCVPLVADRYRDGPPPERSVWRFNHKVRGVAVGEPTRIEIGAPARLHWSADGWQTVQDTEATASGLGLWYVDLPAAMLGHAGAVDFTFYWTEAGHWEGEDFRIEVG